MSLPQFSDWTMSRPYYLRVSHKNCVECYVVPLVVLPRSRHGPLGLFPLAPCCATSFVFSAHAQLGDQRVVKAVSRPVVHFMCTVIRFVLHFETMTVVDV